MSSAAYLLRLLDVNFAVGVACLTTAGCLNRLRYAFMRHKVKQTITDPSASTTAYACRQLGGHARRQGPRGLSVSSASSTEAAESDCLMRAEVQCIELLRQASRILPGQLLHNGSHLCLKQGPHAAQLAESAANSCGESWSMHSQVSNHVI